MYSLEIDPLLERKLRKLAKKDPGRLRALDRKVEQILEDPSVFKPLRGVLHGRYRVHVGPFVLVYEILEDRNVVKLLGFEHHDDAY